MRIALGQFNPTVGDLEGNLSKVIDSLDECQDCSLLILPEMFITGYPPEDLLLRDDFITAVEKKIYSLIRTSAKYRHLSILMGSPYRGRKGLFNACLWIKGGNLQDVYFKRLLPNYGVFDEKRYFIEGNSAKVWEIDGIKVAPTVCEDVWDRDGYVLSDLAEVKPDVVINISASPFHVGKLKERINVISRASVMLGLPIVYANLVGGQDELVFDGGAFFVHGKKTKLLSPQFDEGLVKFDFPRIGKGKGWKYRGPIAEVFDALVLGVRDYVNKNGFDKVLIGLSGGVDSSLTAAIAVEALGNDRVVGVSMPSRYNSTYTQRDVRRLSENLKIECLWINIENIFSAFLSELSPIFDGLPLNTAEENLQARIRGTLLMALSNKFGWLVLTTGNKSEMSVGYATLYGDMAGGFAVLKDVPKTFVWRLARYYNRIKGGSVIPNSIIRRPPSAELRYGQTDEESLLPYPVLDKIIDAYVEERLSYSEIVGNLDIDKEGVKKILHLIWRAEYKRRQAPPGIKITPLAFGKDWRMPITNKFDPCFRY